MNIVTKEQAIAIHRFVIEYIREVLTAASPAARVELFDEVEAGYCRYCGTDKLPCHCQNDE